MSIAKELFESRFRKLTEEVHKGAYDDAPFGFDYEESEIWCKAQLSLLQWVLEMLDD